MISIIPTKREICCGGDSLCCWWKPPKTKRRKQVQKVSNSQRKTEKQKKSFIEQFKDFVKNRRVEKEHDYEIKIKFLKDECYKVYLRRILENRRLLKVVDIPEFFYLNGWTIDSEAKRLSESAVETVEQKYGRKHIEKCYNARVKEIIKNLKQKGKK